MDLMQALHERHDDKAIALWLDACPQRTVRAQSLSSMLPQKLAELSVKKLVDAGSVISLTEYLVTRESMEVLSSKLCNELKAHSASDQDKQRSLETLRGKILPGIDRAVFQALVKQLVDGGVIVRKGDQLSLPGAQASESGIQNETATKLLAVLSEHYCLEIEELARQIGHNVKEVTAAIGQLAKEHKARIVNYEFVATSEKINEAHAHLVRIWQAKRDISPADFRDALGTSRKYAMALLAYFDDNGITRRFNNSRVLLKNPKVG
jgi:selenocysteine-specific elongation factor